MNAEVFCLRNFSNDNTTGKINAAFPILAIECEVSVPVEKELDAYEEAVLKLLSIGLSKNSVSKALNITQSLCGDILLTMDGRRYIEKIANEYRLTPKAYDALNKTEIDNPEMESKYGYMLVSAIKKEPLWYFYEGDIFNIPHSDSDVVKNKLRIRNLDNDTFVSEKISIYQLEKAFSNYCKITEVFAKKGKEDIPEEEVKVLFADIEADFIESDYQKNDNEQPDISINDEDKKFINTGKLKVRRLKRKEKPLYLQMQIIIDPSVPGGYRVESPFNFNGNDNDLFLRQIQWMRNPMHEVYIGEEKLSQFLTNEINHLFPLDQISADYSVLIINQLPMLNEEQNKYREIYEDTAEIMKLMNRRELSLMTKRNIVGNFTGQLLEKLMNRLILTVPENSRKKTSRRAYNDFKYQEQDMMIEQFAQVIGVNRSILPKGDDLSTYFSAIKRLKYTFGNSIYEKLLNLIVIQYYQPSPQIKKFFSFLELEGYIKTMQKMNLIRNSAIHASGRPFEEGDYDYYIEHVFDVANRLLEALKEAQ